MYRARQAGDRGSSQSKPPPALQGGRLRPPASNTPGALPQPAREKETLLDRSLDCDCSTCDLSAEINGAIIHEVASRES